MLPDPTQFLLVLTRCTALLAAFPLVSMQNFPVRLRVGLGGFMALLIAPTLPAPAVGPATLPELVVLLLGECAIGVLLGFVCRLLFFVLEYAGSLISTEMGLNIASLLSPLTNSRTDLCGVLLFYLGGMLFFTLNLHHWLLVAFQRTYQTLPPGSARLSEGLFTDFVSRTGHIFLLGLLMAAPMIAVAFLINLVFSVLGRAVPQMNIFLESFSFRILAGLLVFGLSLNLVAQHVVNYLHRLPEDVARVAQLLNGP
jgi:flagellar biosynthetic protein FliR